MTPLDIPGIANGYKVDDTVWRGAQPEDSAWPLLAAAGCRCVIDLNSEIGATLKQAELVQGAGMAYFAREWNGILPPSRTQVEQALDLIDALGDNVPVLIHCAHGSDRTGTLCACWRMHHDGWSFEDAMEEAFTSLGLQGMHEFWMAAAVAHYAHERQTIR
jgi:polymorphic toxin system DSP-PTPase phosphatase-like protein